MDKYHETINETMNFSSLTKNILLPFSLDTH